MTAITKEKMTVDEFLVWADGREGRWELADGVPLAMAPERVAHGETKVSAGNALQVALRKAGLNCFAYVDCIAVRLDTRSTFQPDVVVNCGARLGPDEREAVNPIIVVEVLSPSTRAVDMRLKVRRYFELHNLHHYLILDPDDRSVIHHARGDGDLLLTRIASEGMLRFEPPGFELEITQLFPEPYEA